MLGHLAPNRYELDLSNEVVYILVGQEAAKYLRSKLEVKEKIADSAQLEPYAPLVG